VELTFLDVNLAAAMMLSLRKSLALDSKQLHLLVKHDHSYVMYMVSKVKDTKV